MCFKSWCKALVLVSVIYFLSVSLCVISQCREDFDLPLGHTIRDVTPFSLTPRLVSTMLWTKSASGDMKGPRERKLLWFSC